MSVEFKQIRGINSRKFVLFSDKIFVESKTLRKIDKYEVKLDRLGLNIHYQSDNTLPGKIFLGVCISLILGSLFMFFSANEKDSSSWLINSILGFIIACFVYFKQHQDDIYLVGGQQNLVFYREIPNEKDVLNFIEKIKTQTKSFLKEKYTSFDQTTKEEDYYNILNWLCDQEIITQKEYSEYKRDFEIHKLM